ncbi:MAG: glycosyl hydrolase 43 family protein [Firmicutes bacterium]|nr:glycosyl hydrolase 43 family protein [Bacillota bacterium]
MTREEARKKINPITKMDYPDADVIRVDDTYYMISTTMHFMPGGVILRSYDLVNWEICSYVYDKLEDNVAHNLGDGKGIYGKGMWAGSLRYANNRFYVCFSANDTGKTYLFDAENIEGPWNRRYIEGFYHDPSLLFDGVRTYIVYGNRDIWITELDKSLAKPKQGGLHRMIISDAGNPMLGYEGAHIYKINQKYYVFLIHSLRDRWRRVEACFASDSLEGEFTGGDVLNDDRGYCGQGVAQGGIVDTPDGDWYAILFQDSGAVGRIPVLIPIHFENDFPIFGDNGKIPEEFSVKSTRPDYEYAPLYTSDDFRYQPDRDGKINLNPVWQWNHNPKDDLWSVTERPGALRIYTDKVVEDICQANNILTQRMLFPGCSGIIKVDAQGIKEGDYAGICALQGCYQMIAITKEDGQYYAVVMGKPVDNDALQASRKEVEQKPTVYAKRKLDSAQVTFKLTADFLYMKDEVRFFIKEDDWVGMGESLKVKFKLDHFTGCRFGLFMFSTKEAGGFADLSDFRYEIY